VLVACSESFGSGSEAAGNRPGTSMSSSILLLLLLSMSSSILLYFQQQQLQVVRLPGCALMSERCAMQLLHQELLGTGSQQGVSLLVAANTFKPWQVKPGFTFLSFSCSDTRSSIAHYRLREAAICACCNFQQSSY
jgi:hypothetical protein